MVGDTEESVLEIFLLFEAPAFVSSLLKVGEVEMRQVRLPYFFPELREVSAQALKETSIDLPAAINPNDVSTLANI